MSTVKKTKVAEGAEEKVEAEDAEEDYELDTEVQEGSRMHFHLLLSELHKGKLRKFQLTVFTACEFNDH